MVFTVHGTFEVPEDAWTSRISKTLEIFFLHIS